jgi:transglutaminase-like putative cysteine protease
MATTTSQGDRRLLLAALAVLAAVVGVTFGRVFQGATPALRMAAAGVLAVAIGALLGRRNLALSLLASAVGLFLALGVLVFPGTTWAGIPTLDTVDAILDALGRTGERAAIEIAPAPALPSLLTAATIAVWAACAASHALAVRARTTVLPILPGAALLGFVGVVTEEPPRPAYVLAFLGATFLLLFAEAVVRAPGRVGAGPRRAVVSARWARTLGAVAVLLALAIPGVLPGYGGTALLKLGGPGDRVSVAPIVDIRPNLLRNPPADLFTVRAERPSYWRMVVLDTFNGTQWTSSGLSRIEGPLLSGSSALPVVPPLVATPLVQEFEMAELSTSWLPAAPQAVSLTVGGELGARHDTDTGVIALDAPTDDGVRYTVVSSTPAPTAAQLERQNPAGFFPNYSELPEGMPNRLRQIATEITAGARNPFEQMYAIQEHLQSFQYDEHAPAGHGSNAMLNFLEETQQGYCEQFAGTMAVLARTLGMPSRVAVGFLPGDRDRSGRYRVTTSQVHAWPEIFFGDYGWLAFEPTPGRNNPVARYLVDVPAVPRPDANLRRGARGSPELQTEALAREEGFARPAPEPGRLGGRRRAEPPLSPGVALALVGLGLALLAALVIPPVKAIRRWMSLRDRGDPRRRVVAAYRWMNGGAADLGLGRRRGETLEEYRARLIADGGAPAELVGRLTGLTSRAVYSIRSVGHEHADEAVAAARALVRELRNEAGVRRTVLGAIRPS